MPITLAKPTLPIQKVARFTAVVAIAMAAGHLAQTLAAKKPAAMPVAALTVQTATHEPTNIVQLSSLGQEAAVAPAPIAPVVNVCAPKLSLQAVDHGMLGVTLTAPCNKGERIVLGHAGLAVTARVGEDGTLITQLPGLTAEATVTALFADGSKSANSTTLTGFDGLRRFGVQWQGADAFAIHAITGDAALGSDGHVWNGSTPADPSHGFLTVLGDIAVENPLLAEVYTYPAASTPVPEIFVEAAVLATTCGHDLLGDVLESQNGQVRITELTLAMPDCSAVGDFLVLNNLASGMKIAAK